VSQEIRVVLEETISIDDVVVSNVIDETDISVAELN